MAYITTTDLAQRLGAPLYARLTDRDDGEIADESIATRLCDEASAFADSYFARRYATPVDLGADAELSRTVQARVLDVAQYLAWRDNPFFSDVPDRIRLTYEDATRWLERVARGELVLPAALRPDEATALADNAPRVSARPRPFTADELDGL